MRDVWLKTQLHANKDSLNQLQFASITSMLKNSDGRTLDNFFLSTILNRKIIETTRYIVEEVSKIDGIYIMGDPEVSVIAIGQFFLHQKALNDRSHFF